MIVTKNSTVISGQSYLTPRANVREGLSGRGVFTTAEIKKDEIVAMWGGKVYTVEQLSELPETLQHYALQIDQALYIAPDSEESIDDAEFFNHSCGPNCGIRGQVALVAMRDIAIGEELTFDYSMAEAFEQSFQCSCDSSLCRDRIRASDHNLPDLRKRYKGYFSSWLEKKHADSEYSPIDLKHYGDTGAWGLATALDLHDCNPDTIRSSEKIHEYTLELCERIKVKCFGEPVIVHFGEDERIAGYSLVQLIETSLVSGHFANLTNRVYMDVFSCAYYDPHEVAEYSKRFFEAQSYNIKTTLRF